MELENLLRAYAYLAKVLLNQQHDPFCRKCKALVNTTEAAREEIVALQRDHASEIQSVPQEFQHLFATAASALAAMMLPEQASGQKRAGNCKLPEGVCLVKLSRGLVTKILQLSKEERMDTLEMAKKMEMDAISFYTEAAGKTKYPAGKKIFLSIVEDEKRHLEMITQVIKGLQVTSRDVNPIQNVRTVFETMKDEMMKKVQATSDELEAFKIAMQMEKEGKEFYQKMLAAGAKSDNEQSLLKRLISEEEKHYAIFANTHDFLANTGNWFMWDERGIVEG